MQTKEKKIVVNGIVYKTKKETVMEALDEIGIEVPRLCKHPDLKPLATCRMCVVEANGRIVTSCNTSVSDGMKIETDTKDVVRNRVNNLKLILSNHTMDCLNCFRNGDCELQKLADEFNLPTLFEGEKRTAKPDNSSPSIKIDGNKCILCGRCVEVCKNQGISVIDFANRGFNTSISTAFGHSLGDTGCISCGQCVLYCPTGALTEKDDRISVIKTIENKNLFVAVQIAPSIRVSIGEEFGLAPGKNVEGKIVTALKNIGFDAVFDTSFAADMTIVEEATELVKRIKDNKLPMFTSCCPAWVNYSEMHYPEILPRLSTSKSPHEMMGALIKSYYAKKNNLDPKNIVVVSIMPCVAKKDEISNINFRNDGLVNVDYTLTTREAAKIFKEYGIELSDLKDSPFDMFAQGGTGAGKIFGRSGGVMEAALRTAAFYLGEKNPKIEYDDLKGLKAIKSSSVDIKGKKIRVAAVNGMLNFINNRDMIMSNFDFIEVMACPGGCIGGGGQPQPHSMEKVRLRAKGLNSIDRSSNLRLSHENPVLKKVYKEFLDSPGSEKAEKYLHRNYMNKKFVVKG